MLWAHIQNFKSANIRDDIYTRRSVLMCRFQIWKPFGKLFSSFRDISEFVMFYQYSKLFCLGHKIYFRNRPNRGSTYIPEERYWWVDFKYANRFPKCLIVFEIRVILCSYLGLSDFFPKGFGNTVRQHMATQFHTKTVPDWLSSRGVLWCLFWSTVNPWTAVRWWHFLPGFQLRITLCYS